MNLTKINKDFFIRYYPDSSDTHTNRLITAKGLIKMVGLRLADKHTVKAYNRGGDKYSFKLRRGIKFELVPK